VSRTKQYEPEEVAERAMILFWRQGYGATSIEDLADATGLSRSSLYSEYGSKRALFSAAVNHYLEYFNARLAPVTEGNLDTLEEFFEQIADEQSGKPAGCLMVDTMTEFGLRDAAFSDDAELYRLMIREAFAAALAAAELSGDIERETSNRRAEFLSTQLLGLFVTLRTHPVGSHVDASVQAILAEIRSWRRLSFKRRLEQNP
jgi:TetR/AcrR family transcriptional repressor of nem operon